MCIYIYIRILYIEMTYIYIYVYVYFFLYLQQYIYNIKWINYAYRNIKPEMYIYLSIHECICIIFIYIYIWYKYVCQFVYIHTYINIYNLSMWGHPWMRLASGVGSGNSTAKHARQVGSLFNSEVFKKTLCQIEWVKCGFPFFWYKPMMGIVCPKISVMDP